MEKENILVGMIWFYNKTMFGKIFVLNSVEKYVDFDVGPW